MAQYLLLYHDPKPVKSKFDLIEKVAKKDLYTREISNAVLDGGNPTVDGKVITLTDIKPLTKGKVTDYCIIEARDPDEAIEMARGAPSLSEGGTAEVYQLATEE